MKKSIGDSDKAKMKEMFNEPSATRRASRFSILSLQKHLLLCWEEVWSRLTFE